MIKFCSESFVSRGKSGTVRSRPLHKSFSRYIAESAGSNTNPIAAPYSPAQSITKVPWRIPQPASCLSVQQLPSFQLIYWSSACEDVNHLSFAARSLPRSARSNRYHQSLSLPFDRKYVHCVRGEDEGEAKREIIKQISSSSGAVKRNKKTESPIGRSLLKTNHPIAPATNTNSSFRALLSP
jgi:hypothetical protein